jgi:hypothetical protein
MGDVIYMGIKRNRGVADCNGNVEKCWRQSTEESKPEVQLDW